MTFFKNKKLTSFIILAGFILIFFWEKQKLSTSLNLVENDVATSKKQGSAAPSEKSGLSGSNPVATQPEAPAAAQTASEFAAWLKNEASMLDKSDANNSEKEIILKEKASKFSAENIQFLKNTATDVKVSANERIMAAYFLTLSTENYVGALGELAAAPYSLPNPQPVHSLGETTLMQEKAIRVMAIDEIFARFQNNSVSADQVNQFIGQILDADLKQYAEKRWRELK